MWGGAKYASRIQQGDSNSCRSVLSTEHRHTLSIERLECFFDVVSETADNEFTKLLPPAP